MSLLEQSDAPAASPDAALEFAMAALEVFLASAKPRQRERFAKALYRKLEERTATTPIGSDPVAILGALKAWRRRIPWVVAV